MAKRNVFVRALRSARDLLKDYIRPGARTAEDKIDDLLKVLGEARRELARQRRRIGTKRRTAGKRARRSTTVRRARNVRRKAAARRKRRS